MLRDFCALGSARPNKMTGTPLGALRSVTGLWLRPCPFHRRAMRQSTGKTGAALRPVCGTVVIGAPCPKACFRVDVFAGAKRSTRGYAPFSRRLAQRGYAPPLSPAANRYKKAATLCEFRNYWPFWP